MDFDDILGHDEIKSTLRSMIDSERIPHALLFGGPAGVGKMQLALATAQYVQCTDRHNGHACGRCRSCLQYRDLSNPDLHFIYPVVKPAGKTVTYSSDYLTEWKQMLADEPFMRREHWLELLRADNRQPAIYVSDAAELTRSAQMSAYASDYKIYIIWLPESLQPEAANKLLKLIEEPWENTLFLMVSNEPANILPTIFSRTQRLNFRPLPTELIEKYMREKLHVETSTARRLAPMAEGNLLKATDMAVANGESTEFADLYRQLMRFAYARKIPELLALTEKLDSFGREKIMRFLQYCGHMARENYIYNLRLPSLTHMTAEEEAFSQRFAPFITSGNIEGIASETDTARRDISRNANAKYVLFDYALRLCSLIRTQQ